MSELDEVRQQIDAIRDSINTWDAMQDEIHTSPTRVHNHICHHVEEVVTSLIDVIDQIEDVLDLRRTQVILHRNKINEIIVYLQNADSLKLKLGGTPTQLPGIT